MRRIVSVLALLIGGAVGEAAMAEDYPPCRDGEGYCIVTGNPNLTYFKIGKDLSERVAVDAGVPLIPIEGNGSQDNVRRMRYQPGVKFAIVQSDVLQFYRNQAESGNAEARELISPLRVIQALYSEEVHILAAVPEGNPTGGLHYVHELAGKRIAVGPLGSGSAMTAILAYRLLFGQNPADNQLYFSPVEEALNALAKHEVDAFFQVAGQPVSRFSPPKAGNPGIPAEGRKYIRMLALDPNHPSTAKLLQGPYYTATIKAENYPWLEGDVSSFAVKAFLISQKYTNQTTRNAVTAFTRSLCRNVGQLQQNAHPKWKQVSISKGALPGGWEYSEDALRALNSPECTGATVSRPSGTCSEVQKILMTPGCS